MNPSPQFAINWNDVLKGLIMAIGTPVLLIIQQTITSGQLTFNWKQIGSNRIVCYILHFYTLLYLPYLFPTSPQKQGGCVNL